MHLHIAARALVAGLDAPAVAAMVAVAKGNLAEPSAYPGAASLFTKPERPQPRTHFDPNFKFGPPAGAPATFVLTMSAPSLVVRTRPPARNLSHSNAKSSAVF